MGVGQMEFLCQGSQSLHRVWVCVRVYVCACMQASACLHLSVCICVSVHSHVCAHPSCGQAHVSMHSNPDCTAVPERNLQGPWGWVSVPACVPERDL